MVVGLLLESQEYGDLSCPLSHCRCIFYIFINSCRHTWTCTYTRHMDISYFVNVNHSHHDDVIIFSAHCTAFVQKCSFVETSSAQIRKEPLSFWSWECPESPCFCLVNYCSFYSKENLNLEVDLPYKIHPLNIVVHHEIAYAYVF